MLKSTLAAPVILGAATACTRADSDGKKMELIPGQFYVETAADPDLLPLGSVRAATRADTYGPRAELVPGLHWGNPEDAAA